jgi:hypothetical protein
MRASSPDSHRSATRMAAARRLALRLLATIALVIAAAPCLAEVSGITRAGRGCSDEGEACHGLASDSVTVTIDGPDRLDFGEIAIYSIAIDENIGGLFDVLCDQFTGDCGAGLNVAAEEDGVPYALDDGTPDDANTRFSIVPLGETAGEITHLFNANLHGPDKDQTPGSVGVYDYTFAVTAPEQEAILTLFVAMNAFNGDDEPCGISETECDDRWNTTTLIVNVPEPGGALAMRVALIVIGGAAARRRALLKRK